MTAGESEEGRMDELFNDRELAGLARLRAERGDLAALRALLCGLTGHGERELAAVLGYDSPEALARSLEGSWLDRAMGPNKTDLDGGAVPAALPSARLREED